MPVMRKPAGSKALFGDNFLTQLFPGDSVEPSDMLMPLGGAAIEASGPLGRLLARVQELLGTTPKVPTNVGDALLRDHALDSRISGLEPPPRTGLAGKSAEQVDEDIYKQMMDNGAKRTTPELRKPK